MRRYSPICFILLCLLLSCGRAGESEPLREASQTAAVSEDIAPSPPADTSAEAESASGSVLENDSIKDSASENSISQDSASENAVSEDSVSEDSISGNSISDDSVSEDSASENSVSEDSASENKAPRKPKPVNLIIDTDFTTDADDVAAIRIATSLAKLGRVNIVGAAGSGPGEGVPKGIHGVLCYDGFPAVPIGQTEGHDDIPVDEIYSWGLANRYCDMSSYNCSSAVDMYKAVLAYHAARGEKVRIVVIGFLTNIADLLADPEGMVLVMSAVDSIWIDGGVYPGRGTDFNFSFFGGVTEAAIFTFQHCPVPMMFVTNSTGADTARAVHIGSQLPALDPGMVDPVHIAYDAFEKSYEKDLSLGHFAYDALAVWAAGLPLNETNLSLLPVDAEMFFNGCNEFTPNPASTTRFVVERALPGLEWYEQSMDALLYMGVK